MTAKLPAFFDEASPPQAPSSSSQASKLPSFFDEETNQGSWIEKEPPPISEQLKNAPLLAAREGGAGLWSLPSLTAESFRFIGGKLREAGKKQAAKEGREYTPEEEKFHENVVNYIPDLVKSLSEKFPNAFPTYQSAKEKLTKNIAKNEGVELPEKGRGFIERAAEGVGKAVPVAIAPGSLPVKLAAIGTSALTEGLDLSEKNKLIGNLSIPAITQLVQAIVQRRYIPSGPEAARMMAAGERFGMTNQELAPILATPGQVGRHGKRAATIEGTRQSFEQTGNALGDLMQQLQTQPAAQTAISAQNQATLVGRLQNIVRDMRQRTHSPSPQETMLMDFIDNAITDIQQNGSTPRQLIGTWRSVNRVGAGRTELRRILEPLRDAIDSVAPDVARDLTDLNSMYSSYARNLGQIKPTQFNHFMDAGELQQVLGSIFTHQPGTTLGALTRFMTVKAFEKMSSMVLTNPTAQSLARNFGQAVRDGRQASARAVGLQLKNYVQKNLPEEYKEVDWEGLGIKD